MGTHLVEMEVVEVTKSISSEGVFLVILQEKNGTEKVPVMVGSEEALQVLSRMRARSAALPTLHDAFKKTLELLGASLKSVLIYKVERGVFHTAMMVEHDGEVHKVDCGIADALGMAMACKCSVLMPRELVEAQHLHEQADGSVGMPISSVDVSVLQDALDNAIASEDYELAAKLRDEINRRK